MDKIRGIQGFSQLLEKGTSDSFHTLDLDVEDESPFFVMEKLGTSLMDIFDASNQKLMKIDVLKLGIELLKLIEKLHSFDIIHQDIKFDNIMFTQKFPKVSKSYINSHFEKLDNI
jgi:serine/threonine protein kinase